MLDQSLRLHQSSEDHILERHSRRHSHITTVVADGDLLECFGVLVESSRVSLPRPFVDLDKQFYRAIDEFESRFPAGPPSLREAERLVVHGDVTFGAGVVVRGAVELGADEPRRIEDGAVLGDA